jgi:sec-independent protein translocase protein TatA
MVVQEESMPFGLQPTHLIVIVAVAFVVFGPKRLPQIGRWLGKTFTELRKGARDMADGFREESTVSEQAAAAARMSHGNVSEPAPSTAAVTPAQPSASPLEGAIYCTQCGTQNVPDSRFCRKCGTKIAA